MTKISLERTRCSAGFSANRADRNLECGRSAFVVADADDFIHPGKKNLSIADLAAARGLDDRVHRRVHQVVRQYQLNLDLRNQVHTVFPAPIRFSVTLLAAVPAHLGTVMPSTPS